MPDEQPSDFNAGVPGITKDVEVRESQARALKALLQTQVGNDKEKHHASVCLICDEHILGGETICWVTKAELLMNSSRLSVEMNYEEGLNPLLRCQYLIEDDEDLANLLLSPRAPIVNGLYMTCESCKRALARDRLGHLPGQFFISNQWAIGCLPMNFGIVDDLISMMIAPVHPYAYIFAFTGRSRKKIKGHFTFFHADACCSKMK